MSLPQSQTVLPYEGVDYSTAFDYIKQTKAVHIKNWTDEINIGNVAGSASASAHNRIKMTKVTGNYLIDRGLNAILANDRYAANGFHYYKPKNWGFAFVFDKNAGNHLIYRIDGNQGGAIQVVYQRAFLNLINAPRHFINKGRCVCITSNRYNRALDIQEELTYLIFVNAWNETRFLCVEDSIATNGFTDAPGVSYFSRSQLGHYEEGYINLGVPPPMKCIAITAIPRYTNDMSAEQLKAERSKANRMSYKGFQWRLRFIDIWGRPSEYGIISNQYFNALGGVCTSLSAAPRSVRLRFDCGTPLINKVELLVRNCNGRSKGLSLTNDWYLYDTIEKYQDTQPWYTRSFREELGYDAANNTIEYVFSNDKERIPVDFSSTNRLFNPLPLVSAAVGTMDRRIALARNTRDFEPWDRAELEKVTFTIQPPALSACSYKTQKITVWGLLYNEYAEKVIRIRRDAANVVFAWGTSASRGNDAYQYKQVLPKDQEGIIGYLVGAAGQNFCISKQHKYSTTTTDTEYVGLDYKEEPEWFNDPVNIPLQKWEFNVLPGKYVFRVASHQSSPTDDYTKTSTRVVGQTALSNPGSITAAVTELLIDATTADVEIFTNPLMIYDVTSDADLNRVSMCEGYVYEDQISKVPLEGARIDENNGNTLNTPNNRTDHNGYYFMCTKQPGLQVSILGVKNGVNNQLLKKSRTTHDNKGELFRFDTLYCYEKETVYPVGDRFYIKGRMVLCDDPLTGVAGAVVIYRNGAAAFTDGDGYFSLIGHNHGDGSARNDELVYGQRGTCHLLRCDAQNVNNCNYAFDNVAIAVPVLNLSNTERDVTVATLQVRIKGYDKRGPHTGGRYGICFFLHDWMGRQPFVQASDSHILDIPTLQETGVFDFSKIAYQFNNCVFPPWCKSVSFGVTENLVEEDYLTWAADRVQYVDNTGNTNNAAPTAIRLYYEGLNEYNKQKNYSTTTGWDFLISDETNSSVVTGDQIEFLAYGNGTLFTERIICLAQYDKEGKYVQIEYRDELANLTDNTLVRLLRPKLSNDKQFYYELCPMIDIAGGLAVQQTGFVNLTDAYLLPRQIPVPVVVTGKTTNDDGDEIETSTTVNQLRSFPFLFEHHSPSDTWGSHCWNKGRVSARSTEEKQHILKMEIAAGDTVSPTGSLNYIGYFEGGNVQQFDEQEWGGITGVISGVRTMLVICEHGNFTIGYADNRVYADGQGGLTATPGNQLFSAPQRNAGSYYGCQLDDYNTIQERKGIVMFLDSTGSALVRHEGGTAKDISDDVKHWLTQKIKAGGNKYFIGGMDPKRDEYLLTDAGINPTDAMYINDLADPYPVASETMVYDLERNIFKGHRSFIPEFYGAMDGEKADMQLISFRRGKPWFHYDVNQFPGAVQYCKFFGTEVSPYMKLCFNAEHLKTKAYLYIQVHARGHVLYCDEIVTEKGQTSRLMPNWFAPIDKVYSADFKCATNTIADPNILGGDSPDNLLLDGDTLQGKYMVIRLTCKLADRLKYCEVSGVEVFFNGC